LPKRVSIIAACFSTKLNNLKSKSGKDILLWTHENSLRKNQSSTPVSPQSNDGGKKLRLFPQKCPHHAPNIISQFWLTEEICNKPTSNLWDYKNQNHEVIDYFIDDQGCPTPLQFNFLCTFLTKSKPCEQTWGRRHSFLDDSGTIWRECHLYLRQAWLNLNSLSLFNKPLFNKVTLLPLHFHLMPNDFF
jgi:hypothetical protein